MTREFNELVEIARRQEADPSYWAKQDSERWFGNTEAAAEVRRSRLVTSAVANQAKRQELDPQLVKMLETDALTIVPSVCDSSINGQPPAAS